jgi:hypothetical protein
MTLYLGIVFLLVGFLFLIKPKLFFELIKRWKSLDESDTSDIYIFSVRFGATMFIFIGITTLIWYFLNLIR